jgi:hypothetical protein
MIGRISLATRPSNAAVSEASDDLELVAFCLWAELPTIKGDRATAARINAIRERRTGFISGSFRGNWIDGPLY